MRGLSKEKLLEAFNYIDLDDDTVLNMAKQVPDIFEQVKQAVAVFSDWLDEMAD